MPQFRSPLGVHPVLIQTMYLTFGAGKPLSYAETGFQVSGLFGHALSEAQYRPHFLEACRRGFVTFQSWDDLRKQFGWRKVVWCPRTIKAIKDIAIFEGGDYAFYKYFDPTMDHKKDPSQLNRFAPANIQAPNLHAGAVGGGKGRRRKSFLGPSLTFDSREEPCPCGSKKTFRQCHWGKQGFR